MSPEQYLAALEATGMQDFLSEPEANRLIGSDWELRGPIGEFYNEGKPANGRISGMQVTDADGYTVYVGAAGGGLWKVSFDDIVANGGEVIWTSIGDSLPNPVVRAFDIDPTNEEHIVVGTGDRGRLVGAGMFVTYDGGDTWDSPANVPVTTNYYSRLEFQPGSGGQVLLAGSKDGLLRSINGGEDWTTVMTDKCFDFMFDPSDPTRVYAASELNGINGTDGIYRSVSSGESGTWEMLPTTGLPQGAAFEGAKIDISQSEPGTMVVLVHGKFDTDNDGDTENVVVGLFITENADTENPDDVVWTDISGTDDPEENVTLMGWGQSHHALTVAIKPTDPDTIFAGAGCRAVTTNGGVDWLYWDHTNAAGEGSPIGGTHADCTQYKFFNLSEEWNQILWICNDGGIYFDDLAGGLNGGETMSYIGGPATGLAISQIHRADTNRGFTGLGLQDNGSVYQEGANSDWRVVSGGDGQEFTIVDPENGDAWYSYGVSSGRIYRRLAGGTYTELPEGTDTDNLTFGSGGLWMFYDRLLDAVYTHAGTDIITRPEDLSSNWSVIYTSGAGASVKAVWGSPVDGRSLFFYESGATRDLQILKRDAANNWGLTTLAGLAPEGGSIVTICPSPHWSSECWVGLNSDEGDAKVIHVKSDGTTEDVTGGLDILNQVRSIVAKPFDPGVLYVGTDIGIYRTTNGGESWEPFQSGLAIGIVKDITWKTDPNLGWGHELVAFTYGRGVWSRAVHSKPVVFVDKSSSGAEDGTLEHPYQTLAAAVNVAPDDAIIAMRSNTYLEALTIPEGMTLMTWGGDTTIK